MTLQFVLVMTLSHLFDDALFAFSVRIYSNLFKCHVSSASPQTQQLFKLLVAHARELPHKSKMEMREIVGPGMRASRGIRAPASPMIQSRATYVACTKYLQVSISGTCRQTCREVDNVATRGQSRCETLRDEYLIFLAIPWYRLADLVSRDQ